MKHEIKIDWAQHRQLQLLSGINIRVGRKGEKKKRIVNKQEKGRTQKWPPGTHCKVQWAMGFANSNCGWVWEAQRQCQQVRPKEFWTLWNKKTSQAPLDNNAHRISGMQFSSSRTETIKIRKMQVSDKSREKQSQGIDFRDQAGVSCNNRNRALWN